MDFEMWINIIGKDEDLLEKSIKLCDYIKDTYYEYCDIPLNMLYMIQDIVWYNLECKDKHLGLNSLADKGSQFKTLQQLTNNTILNKQDKQQLAQELSAILKKWNPEWEVITVYTDINENKTKKLNKIIIHKKDESPRKYDYYKKTNLLDENGKYLYLNKDAMLGEVDGKLGEYYLSNILKDKVNKLLQMCKDNDKFLFINEQNTENI